MIASELAEESLSLDLRIHARERRILERRKHIGQVVAGFGPKVRTRIGAPGMLAAAVGFGVFLHRSTRRDRDRRTWSWVSLLNAAYTSGTLALTLSSWMDAARETETSAERPPFQGQPPGRGTANPSH